MALTDYNERFILDHGMVRLVSHNASDQSVVSAARVSNGIIGDEWRGEKDEKLIRFLLKHQHGTPFEHNSMTFLVKAPLFVVREWHRHRIGWSYNEVSGRYAELEEEFYVPERIRLPHPTNKQGSVDSDDVNLGWMLGQISESSEDAFKAYHRLLEDGMAREMARLVLPLNTYTSFYATCNSRSLMHFLGLRLDEGAQWEIQEYGRALEEIWRDLMPVTHAAWSEGR